MKALVEYCKSRGLLFRSLKPIDLKALGSRKKIGLYLGVDTESYYHILITVQKKSRILRKEAALLMAFHPTLERHVEAKINKKCILIQAPLCSKAKKLLEESGWEVGVIS